MLKSHFFPSDQLYIHSVPPALSQSFRHVECDTCGCRWNADGMPLPLCRYAPCLHSHPKQVPLLVARVDLDVSLVRGCSLVENNLMVKKTTTVQPVQSSDVSRQGRQTFCHVELGFHCATQSTPFASLPRSQNSKPPCSAVGGSMIVV
jgi:hypothetical protein